MKNLSIAIVIAAIFFSNGLTAQQNSKKIGVTASPFQAFTKTGEMQLGIEFPETVKGAWELNLGFRFKGSDNPKESPYFNQLFNHTSIGEVNKGVQFFLFLPIPVSGRDKDWTEKQVHRDYYTNRNIFASAGYKFYLMPIRSKHVQGGLYLTPGLTIGNRNVSEYVYATGQKGYVTVLDKDWSDGSDGWGPIIGFVGTKKLVQEDVYDFSRLEIKQYSRSYVQPYLRLGVQVPFGKWVSVDLGGQATLQGKHGQQVNGGDALMLEPTVKLGVWF